MDTETEYSDGLISIALYPEKLYEFASFFNASFETLEGDNIGRELLDERHLAHAMQVAELIIEKETTHSRTLRDAVQRVNHPMLALDKSGRILEFNAFAAALFDISGRDQPFQRLFCDKTKDDLHSFLNRLSPNGQGVDPDFIELVELERSEGYDTHFVCVTPWRIEDGEYCLIVQAINIRWPDHMDPLLQKTFKLTVTEISVFRLLSEGMSVREVADARGTSVATVRTQIREIYAKTGARNQLQFIRLAVGLAALTFDEAGSGLHLPDRHDHQTAKPRYPRKEHWQLLRLSDGRDLDYAVFGDPGGTPLLFFHNEILGDVWPSRLTDYATRRGLKIILPARPYYRRSSGYPKGAFNPTQTAEDFAELLDHLGIVRADILAQTLGGMFALEFASRYPARVGSFTTLSPMLPFSSNEQRTMMPLLHRFISTAVLSSPRMIEFVARAGFALYLRRGSEQHARLFFSSIPSDQLILQNPQTLRDVCDGLAFGHRNNYRPYVEGFRHLLKNPEEMMRKLEVPIQVIIGTNDNNTRLSRVQSLKKAGIEIDVVLAEGGGELLIFSHPELIIDTVLVSLASL